MSDQSSHLRPVLIFAGITLTVGLAGIVYLLMADAEKDQETRVVSMAKRRIDVEETRALPPFQFEKAHGGTLSGQDLRGKVWVADFMYTSCPTVCPTMAASMKEVEESTRDLDNVAFISISVDPDNDTAESLRKFAADKGANTKRWHFLRGPMKDVHALSHQGFGIGEADDPIVGHSVRFALVDAEGKVRGFYHGIERKRFPDVDELKEDIRELVKRGGK